MITYCMPCFNRGVFVRNLIVAAAVLVSILGLFGSAFAYSTWEGRDWGGQDFTPANGDILSGAFTNIGRFLINAGDTIYAGSNSLSLNTNQIIINGGLVGYVLPTLNVKTSTNISLGGTLDQWNVVNLEATGDISLQAGSSINLIDTQTNPAYLSFTVTGGNISLAEGSIIRVNGTSLTPPALNGIPPQGAYSGTYDRKVIVSPVPLPPALLLLASGLSMLAIARRRKGYRPFDSER